MYCCTNCGFLVGAKGETEINEPSRLCPACVPFCRPGYDFDDDELGFDADELGLDPEEEYDA